MMQHRKQLQQTWNWLWGWGLPSVSSKIALGHKLCQKMPQSDDLVIANRSAKFIVTGVPRVAQHLAGTTVLVSNAKPNIPLWWRDGGHHWPFSAVWWYFYCWIVNNIHKRFSVGYLFVSYFSNKLSTVLFKPLPSSALNRSIARWSGEPPHII